MIEIGEIASAVHPSPDAAKRILVLLKFYCDESYDGNPPGNQRGKGIHVPSIYTVGGFLAGADIWRSLENGWKGVNEKWGVPRYHAAHLNGATYEYDGWDEDKRRDYSRQMLGILQSQEVALHGFAVGIYADEYRRIINEAGQSKLGHPQLACFKTVIATIAIQMERIFPRDVRFAVVLDRNPLEIAQVQAFYAMRDNPMFRYSHRLQTCSPDSSDEIAALQTADFMAYESFKVLWRKRAGQEELRAGLQSMLKTTRFHVQMFSGETLTNLKSDIEGAVCAPSGLVVIPNEPK